MKRYERRATNETGMQMRTAGTYGQTSGQGSLRRKAYSG